MDGMDADEGDRTRIDGMDGMRMELDQAFLETSDRPRNRAIVRVHAVQPRLADGFRRSNQPQMDGMDADEGDWTGINRMDG